MSITKLTVAMHSHCLPKSSLRGSKGICISRTYNGVYGCHTERQRARETNREADPLHRRRDKQPDRKRQILRQRQRQRQSERDKNWERERERERERDCQRKTARQRRTRRQERPTYIQTEKDFSLLPLSA